MMKEINMPKNIKPLHNYVVIEKIDDKTKSEGGIHFIRTPKHEPCIAKVIAVGPGIYDDENVFHSPGIEPGDHIAYLRPFAKTFEIDNEYVVMLKFTGILGKVKK
jgi:chaperonin GroES